jgi:hypothetical protein
MKFARIIGVVLALVALAAGKCLPISDAPSRVGDTACITGTVQKVTVAEDGSHHLEFCSDAENCPFSAFVPARSLRDVGDIRQLGGRTIKIYGKITARHGESEMLLRDVKQLRGEAARIPPIPKGYDVEKRGKVSVGQFRATKQAKPKRKKSLYTDGSIEDEMSSEN